MSKPVKRYALNANQIHILKLLFKFRFMTSNFLASYKAITRTNSRKALVVLMDQEYVGAYYHSSYKLLGKGARYYLAPKGLKYLKDNTDLNEQVLHAMYKNRSVSQGFMDHNIDAGDAYLHIRNTHPKQFEIFTRTELAGFEDFPSPKPDLYLRGLTEDPTLPYKYFIELFHDAPPKNARKRLDELIEHYDHDGWEQDDYPTLLFVLADSRSESYFTEYAQKKLEGMGMEDEITILTTSVKALCSTTPSIWSGIQDKDKLISLSNL